MKKHLKQNMHLYLPSAIGVVGWMGWNAVWDFIIKAVYAPGYSNCVSSSGFNSCGNTITLTFLITFLPFLIVISTLLSYVILKVFKLSNRPFNDAVLGAIVMIFYCVSLVLFGLMSLFLLVTLMPGEIFLQFVASIILFTIVFWTAVIGLNHLRLNNKLVTNQ